MKLTTYDKKLQNPMIRFLMVDSQQITMNTIVQHLEQEKYNAQGRLLDDRSTFEKLLNLQWDVIIFNHAYDFDYTQALDIVDSKEKIIPIIVLSQLEPNSPEALKLYRCGIFELINTESIERLILTIARAANYSRLLRREHQLAIEIDKLQQQTQNLVETTEQAVAVFQEGIHSYVNEQYAKIFSISEPDSVIGFPILDTLQPLNVTEFKQQLKRLSKGDFSQATFSIECQNPNSRDRNLVLQFSAITYDDEPALQMLVMTSGHATENPNPVPHTFYPLSEIYQHINYAFTLGTKVHLFLYCLREFPSTLYSQNWNTISHYMQCLATTIKQNAELEPLRISEHVFLLTYPVTAGHESIHDLTTLRAKLPEQIEYNNHLLPIAFELSHQLLENLPQESQLPEVLEKIFKHTFGTEQDQHVANSESDENSELEAIHLGTPIAIKQKITTASNEIQLIEHNLEQTVLSLIETNQIELFFQQLYDKEDIDTHIYEVTASIFHNNKHYALENVKSVNLSASVASKLDRWVLVEACKRLHQFLPNCPKARIIVNIHVASLADSGVISLISKLVNLINSKYTRPLTLQLHEDEVLLHLAEVQNNIYSLQEQNVGITINAFGQSAHSIKILQQLKINAANLAAEYSEMLNSDEQLVELQQKLDQFKSYNQEVHYRISNLDNMTLFANAWNIDVRYLQGQYYQPKLHQFSDNSI